MPRRKRKSNNPAGRPVTVDASASVLVRGPPQLLAAVEQKAQREGVSVSEGWRRAAREWTQKA